MASTSSSRYTLYIGETQSPLLYIYDLFRNHKSLFFTHLYNLLRVYLSISILFVSLCS
nr:MAG TPA: hypothetical protein [Caudoviricetes sp.]